MFPKHIAMFFSHELQENYVTSRKVVLANLAAVVGK